MKTLFLRLFTLLVLASFFVTACAQKVIIVSIYTPTPAATQTRPAPVKRQPTRAPVAPTKDPQAAMGVSKSALKGVAIQLWHGLDGQQTALLEQIAAEFNLTNPWGLNIELTGYGSLAALVTELEKTPTPPDGVLALPEHLLTWDEKLTDLSPYLAHPEFGFSPTEQADFPPAFLSQDLIGERRLGMPAIRSARFLFYNQTWAKELGFASAPKTAEAFREQACAANASFKTDTDLTNDGFGGWIIDSDPWTAYSWFKAAGGEVYTQGAYSFENDSNIATLVYLKKLRDDGCAWFVPPTDLNLEDSLPPEINPYEHLPRRNALFVTGNLSGLNQQQAAFAIYNSADQWTVLPFPGEIPTTAAYGPSFGVFKNGPAKQLGAWLFIRWMLTPESQARWVEASGLLPVRSAALGLIPNYKAAHPQWFAAVGYSSQMTAYPQTPSWGLARHILGDGFSSFFFLNLPPEQSASTLAQMDTTLADLLK